MNINNFKIGDVVMRISPSTTGDCSYMNQNFLLLYYDDNYIIGVLDSRHYPDAKCFSKENGFMGGWIKVRDNKMKLLITNNNKKIMSIKDTIKNLFRTEPEKTFVKVGFIDEHEQITDKGSEALEYVLWEKNKTELKALADKICLEQEEKK